MLDLPGIHLDATQTDVILSMMATVKRDLVFRYPWDGLEQTLGERAHTALPIVGYGSMLNRESAALTLGDRSLGSSQPVVAFGARRIFDYEIPEDVDRYASATHPSARAALNVLSTGELDDVVNGILIHVVVDDIPALKGREIGYDLVPAACLEWNAQQRPPFMAYVLSYPREPGDGERHANNWITPNHDYYLKCRSGAQSLGEGFLKLWLATTYLADGVTPVAQWETSEFPDLGKL